MHRQQIFPHGDDNDSDDIWNSDSENPIDDVPEKEETDWQLKRPYLWQQNEYILKYSVMTDCTFKVGKGPDTKVFKCHKLLLSKASPVFEAMLYGPLAEKKMINITDIELDIFDILLKYVYTSKLPVMINYDSALSLCYAAKKYMLQRVVDMCVKYLWNDVIPATACRGYEFAKLMEVPELAAKCLKVIQEETNAVFTDSNFVDIEHETLMTILMQDNLNIESEENAISAATCWAKAEAARRKPTTNTIPSLRKILGTAFEHLRFLSLTLTEFVAGPMKSDLLSSDEKIAILSCIESSSTATLSKSSISKIKAKRIQLEKLIPTGLQGRNTFINNINIEDRIESIIGFTFIANVNLKGIHISTPHLLQRCVQIPKPNTLLPTASRNRMSPLALTQQNVKIYIQKYCNKIVEKIPIKTIEENIRIIFEKDVSIIADKHYKLMVYIRVADNPTHLSNTNGNSHSSQWLTLPTGGSAYTLYYCS